MKLKILHTEWGDAWGGQEIRIMADVTGLMKRGHQVTLLCPPGSGLDTYGQAAGVDLIKMQIRTAYDLPSWYRIRRIITERSFDIVDTHSSIDSWVTSLAVKSGTKAALVRTRHLSTPISNHPLNFVYRLPDAIVTTGSFIKDQMVRDNGLDPAKIFSIPTGVDITRFHPDVPALPGLRDELGIPATAPVVTMVALMRNWKRHDILLEAARLVVREHPDLKVLVVGGGPDRAVIEQKASDLGLENQVVFTGHREDVPQLLAISDVTALTSDSSEGVPQTVLQYLAMAKPVVGTTAGGIPELIRDGETGLLVPINDAAAVAQAILRLLRDRGLGRRLGLTGRELVARVYDREKMVDQTEQLYYRLVAARHKI
ncbi:MAG: glycosyltransferase family 4 protein [Deltaproteobacteria bacterium]|nr:glycosyltransferase family 4 protein [Deltaproteobacteria bacterium]